MITRHLRIHEKGGAHASAGTSGVSGAQSPQPAASGTLSPSPTRFAEFSALPSQAPAAFQFFQGAGSTQAAALPAGGASGARGGGDELESAYSASGSGAAAPPTQPRFLPLVAPFQPEHSSADEAMEATLQVPSSRDSLLCSPQSPRSLHSASAHSPLSSPRFGAPKCSVDSACDCAPPLPSQDAALLAEAGIGAGAVATCASSLSAGGRPTGSTAEAERPSPEASELFASTNSTGGSSSVPTFTRKSPTPL